MTIAAHETREDKLKWLLRPVEWALGVSFSSACFGFVYWHFGIYDLDVIAPALCAALVANTALLFWAVSRMTTAARGG